MFGYSVIRVSEKAHKYVCEAAVQNAVLSYQ